jgi:hypothetical protein
MMLDLIRLDPRATMDHAGFIPHFLSELDPRPAVEQINERYAHGGGWHDLTVGERGFRLMGGNPGMLKYPGDPPMHPLWEGYLHRVGTTGDDAWTGERIVIYEHAFVAIIQADGSFRVARLD